MNTADLMSTVPMLLDARFPGQWSQLDNPLGLDSTWLLEQGDMFGVVRAMDVTHPFVWIRIGIAIEVPRSEDLAYTVAYSNKDLEAGRAFLSFTEPDQTARTAFVAIDETVPAALLSFGYEPSIQHLVQRLHMSIDHAAMLRTSILKKFGGRPFTGADWLPLMF